MQFKLDLNAFVWGNLRPDLDKKSIKCPHTLEGSIEFINFYEDKMTKSEMSISEFSMLLGVICHFVCDYFCIYHSEKYWRKDMMVEHIAYEMLLHAKLLKLLRSGSMNISYRHRKEESMEELLKHKLKKYKHCKNTITKDIIFAIEASAAVCELIINSSKIYKINRAYVNKAESKTS
jgi:hypothetical protein